MIHVFKQAQTLVRKPTQKLSVETVQTYHERTSKFHKEFNINSNLQKQLLLLVQKNAKEAKLIDLIMKHLMVHDMITLDVAEQIALAYFIPLSSPLNAKKIRRHLHVSILKEIQEEELSSLMISSQDGDKTSYHKLLNKLEELARKFLLK